MKYVVVFVFSLAALLLFFLLNEGDLKMEDFGLCLLIATVVPMVFYVTNHSFSKPTPDDIFMKSTQSALNTIIKIKNETKFSGEIIDLEKEDLILDGYDKGYAIKIDDNQFLYIADEVIDEPQAKNNGKLSMLYINDYPLPKSETCIAEYKNKEGEIIRTEYISCNNIDVNSNDEANEETVDTEISEEEGK